LSQKRGRGREEKGTEIREEVRKKIADRGKEEGE